MGFLIVSKAESAVGNVTLFLSLKTHIPGSFSVNGAVKHVTQLQKSSDCRSGDNNFTTKMREDVMTTGTSE